ncbi:hypothetical protein ACQF5T_29060, partial [Klebsiella pneumoniae]
MTQRLNDLGIVRTRIERPDSADVARLSRFGVATIHEAMGRVGLLRPYIRPAYSGATLCGPAVTVLLQPGDNWMFHVAAEQVQEGDVIVAAWSMGLLVDYATDVGAQVLVKGIRSQVDVAYETPMAIVNRDL